MKVKRVILLNHLLGWLLPSGQHLVQHKVGFFLRGAASVLLQLLAAATLLISAVLPPLDRDIRDTFAFSGMLILLSLGAFWMFGLLYQIHSYRWAAKGKSCAWRAATFAGFFVISIGILIALKQLPVEYRGLNRGFIVIVNVFEVGYFLWALFAPIKTPVQQGVPATDMEATS